MSNEMISPMEALDLIYAQVDPQVDSFAQQMKVTCRKGCSHCCTLLAIITLADGFYLAEELFSREDWKEWLPKLVAASEKFCVPGINKAAWFKKQEPCVFLKDNACTVYSKRPSACRYHMVISPPENCAPNAVNGEVAMLDLIAVEAQTSWKVSVDLAPEGVPLAGPIPLMTLYAMVLLANQKYKDRRDEVIDAAKDLPTPQQWIMTYGEGLFEDAAKALDAMGGEVKPW